MADLPNIPLPSLNHLERINKSLGDITTKLDNVSRMQSVFDFDVRPIDAIERKISNVTKLSKRWGEQLGGVARANRDLQKELRYIEVHNKTLKATIDWEKSRLANANLSIAKQKKYNTLLREHQYELKLSKKKQDELNVAAEKLPKTFSMLGRLVMGDVASAFDKLGKSIVHTGLSAFSVGIQKLYVGINKVYELQERWTRAIGEFRTEFGAGSKYVDHWTQSATEMEGELRALGMGFGASFKEIESFHKGMGFADKTTKEQEQNFVRLGIALGVGSEAVGQFNRAMWAMGGEAKDASDLLKNDLVAGANAAGVSVKDFGQELIQDKDFFVQFGKAGQKAFIAAASYAKKLGISLKALHQFTDMTDTFQSTVEMTAKLNTVFGTSINALDMMLEDDPSKRFEMIREQMRLQGKDTQNLSRQEKKYLADNLHMSVEEVSSALKTGKTLEQISDEREKAEETQRKNQQWLQNSLAKTRKTLYEFSLGWDRVTKAIEKLIKPFTDMIGLTKSTDKARSFGQVMSSVFEKIARFIERIAGNDRWQKFMQRMASEAEKFFVKIEDFATGPDVPKLVDKITTAAHKFYDIMKMTFELVMKLVPYLEKGISFILDHLEGVLGTWVAMKGAIGIGKLGIGIKDTAGLLGGLGKGAAPSAGGSLGKAPLALMSMFGKGGYGAVGGAASTALRGVGGGLLGAGGGMLAGAAGGALGVGSSAAGDIGSIIGGSVGMIWGPLGAAAGGAIGKFVGDLGNKIYEDKFESGKLAKSQRELDESTRKLSDTQRLLSLYDEQSHSLDKKNSVERECIDKLMLEDDRGEIKLDKEKSKQLIEHLDSYRALGFSIDELEKSIKESAKTGTLSAKSTKELLDTEKMYRDLVDASSTAFKELNDRIREEIKLKYSGAKIEAEMTAKQADIALENMKLQKKINDETASQRKDELVKAEQAAYAVQTQMASMGKSLGPGMGYLPVDPSKMSDEEKKKYSDLVEQNKNIEVEVDRLKNVEKTSRKLDEDIIKAQTESNKKHMELNGLMLREMNEELKIRKRENFFKQEGMVAALEEFKNSDKAVGISGEMELRRAFIAKQGLNPDEYMASGGIVSSPTTALIGEAGPEAVIPLRALASGASRQPSKFGGDAAKKMVNFAARSASSKDSGGAVKLVAGDIYLDGNLVGRHLVRQLLTDEG